MVKIIFDGWEVGMRTIPFIRLLNEKAGLSLGESKKMKDSLVNDKVIEITLKDEELAKLILQQARELKVIGHLEYDSDALTQ